MNSIEIQQGYVILLQTVVLAVPPRNIHHKGTVVTRSLCCSPCMQAYQLAVTPTKSSDALGSPHNTLTRDESSAGSRCPSELSASCAGDKRVGDGFFSEKSHRLRNLLSTTSAGICEKLSVKVSEAVAAEGRPGASAAEGFIDMAGTGESTSHSSQRFRCSVIGSVS